jgi:hypothetical protein
MAVVLHVHDARVDAWTPATFEYEDLLMCPICHEDYYTGPCIPHATCSKQHTCCTFCFDRLRVADHAVTCPTCRASTTIAALGVVSERDGLYGALFARARLRWACSGCGHAGATLVGVRAHAATCGEVSMPCPVCDESVKRGALESHARGAHPSVVVGVGGSVGARTRLIVLPRGCVLGIANGEVTVVCAGVETCGTSVEVTLTSRGGVAVVDVTEMQANATRATRVVTEYPATVALEMRVPLCMLPELALARVAGALVAHCPSASSGASETTVVRVRGNAAPHRLPLLTRVTVCAPRGGAQCWARTADGRVVFGTFERPLGDRAIVRLPTGLASVPREHCGAMLVPK